MAEQHCQVGKIHWTETFPFVRLCRTFPRAIAFRPMVLAFCCVMLCYICGRILDAAWKAADGGVLAAPESAVRPEGSGFGRLAVAGSSSNEILAYVQNDAESARGWRQRAAQRWEDVEAEGKAADTADHRQARSDLLKTIDERLSLALERIEKKLADTDADATLSAEDKARQRRDLLRQQDELPREADSLRLRLLGRDGVSVATVQSGTRALFGAGGDDAEQRAAFQERLTAFLLARQKIAEMNRLKPRGPFISLLDYEMHCFAAAIHGVCSGRWGISGSALSAEPAMLGSIASAASGVQWLVTQRPCFAVFLAVAMLVIFGIFGGAICRVAAVRSARDESLPLREALRFSLGKLAALVGAPLLPAAIFVVAGVLMFVGGLLAAIPGLDVIVALSYGLTLLGGVVMAGTLLAAVVGFHLMWPTIAVEASDAFDAVSRSASYVFQRAWHLAFYAFVLLLYGGVSFVIVRLIGTLVLKLSHMATGLGMNLATNSSLSTVGKLDGIWHMPAWQDISLLPGLGEANFWGDFASAPLGGTESVAVFFFRVWVYIVVGFVGAFVVSFYFCGSTQMYFLLRREYDAVDYDEIYYEEPEEEFGEETAAAAPDEPGEQPAPAEDQTGEQPAGDPPPAE